MTTGAATPRVVRAPTADALAELAAHRLADAARDAVGARGTFTVALAGGQTPRAAYARLAAGWRDAVPWGHVTLWFGDERCVPPRDERSNFHMVAAALLDHVPIAPSRVHRMHGELHPDEGAALYDHSLRAAFGDTAADAAQSPTFDVALLGVGPDGHTASLFPGGSAVGERHRWAVAVPAPSAVGPHVPRITVTLPVLCRSREVWFLCAGAAKRPVLDAILRGDPAAAVWPAALVRGSEQTLWLVDAEALPEGSGE